LRRRHFLSFRQIFNSAKEGDKGNSSAPSPDLPHPFGFALDRRGGGNVFPPPLVGGVRGGG